MTGIAVGVEVRASADLGRLARELKEAGDRGLRREVLAGLRLGAKPLITAARDAARAELPKAGGLNEWVASASFGVRTSLSGNPRVRIVATKKGGGHDLDALDRGVIRHPTFGVWRAGVPDQHVTPHIVTGAMERDAEAVRAVLLTAIDEYLRRF